MKPGGGLGVQCKQAFAQRVTAIVLGASGLFDDGDSGALGEPANRRGKIQVFVFHDETKNRAPGAAAEAMIGLTLRIDMKGGRFFPMERAQRPPARSGALERKIGADDLDDIIGFGDTLDGFLGDAGHKSQNTLRANLARGRFRFVTRFLLALVLLASTLASRPREEQEIRKGSVVVVPLTGEVTEAQFYFLRRILKKV